MSRYWTHTRQPVSSKNGAPAFQRDAGKKLNDRETEPPYNANIGPDGPDLNVVGFPTVKAYTKARFMRMEGGQDLIGPLMESGHFTSGTGGQENKWDVAAGVKKASEGLGKVGEALDKSGSAPEEPRGSGVGGIERVQVARSVQRRGRDY